MLPKALKSCPNSNKSPNLVTLLAVLVFVWRTVVEIFLRFLSETNMPIATNRYKPV